MAVAPVTSSRTHSHATQLFWILNIIIVTIIIALFYYPKTPKNMITTKIKIKSLLAFMALGIFTKETEANHPGGHGGHHQHHSHHSNHQGGHHVL